MATPLSQNKRLSWLGKYGCLAMLAYYGAVALSTSYQLVAWPVALLTVVLLFTGKIPEMLKILGSRGGQKGLYFLAFLTGIFLIGLTYLNLFVAKELEPPTPVKLSDLESGSVKTLSKKVRLSGPIDVLYGLGVPSKSSKNPNQIVGWYFPVASSNHPYFNKIGSAPPPSDPGAFPVYLYSTSSTAKGDHLVQAGVVCLSWEGSFGDGLKIPTELTGKKPKVILTLVEGDHDPDDDLKISTAQFYGGCALIAVGFSMFIGTMLRPAPPQEDI